MPPVTGSRNSAASKASTTPFKATICSSFKLNQSSSIGDCNNHHKRLNTSTKAQRLDMVLYQNTSLSLSLSLSQFAIHNPIYDHSDHSNIYVKPFNKSDYNLSRLAFIHVILCGHYETFKHSNYTILTIVLLTLSKLASWIISSINKCQLTL